MSLSQWLLSVSKGAEWKRGSKEDPEFLLCQPQALAVGTYSVTRHFYASLHGMGVENEIQPWPQVHDSESSDS